MAMPGVKITTCYLRDVDSLYASYLPFVENGGIFVPSDRVCNLGDEMFVALKLPGSDERIPINGEVVWINHKSQGNRPQGFAIQFGNDDSARKLRVEIERILAGRLQQTDPTYTI